MSAKIIRIMIVDDHKMFREGLKNLIELDEGINVVEELGSGVECIYKVKSAKPDIILLDINMPDMNGFETLKILNKRKSRPKVIILTVHAEIDHIVRMIDLGADGYILKDLGLKELVRAIKIVYSGERFVQPNLIPLLNSKIIARNIDKEKVALLSERELEILKLVAKGHFNKDIGNILSISERTVKNHLSNAFRKIDCIDRTQAAIFCIRNEIVNVQD